MSREKKLIILDTRNKEDISIKENAEKEVINIPLKELDDRINEIIKYKEHDFLIVGINGTKAYKAALLLSDYGFEKILVVQRGLTEYKIEN